MVSAGPPALLHVVGYLTGTSLYAMLLAMVIRTGGPGARLTLVTAILGVAWNVGDLAGHALPTQFSVARDWISAISYAALGFLAAVALHSAWRGRTDDDRQGVAAIPLAGYACAAAAGAMQLLAAARRQPLPSTAALVLMTAGLAALSIALLFAARRQPHGRRAIWLAALALFAVSALHLGAFHGAPESWLTELLGHHASIPLAFAILYQDYRFGFADLFLKRALTLLALITIVVASWSLLEPSLVGAPTGSPGVWALLMLWVGTAFAFPWLRQRIAAFVDRIILRRANYATVIDQLTAALASCASEREVLSHVQAALEPALSAESVQCRSAAAGPLRSDEVLLPTAEEPRTVLTIGRLTGGRRLLSDDIVMLERVALAASRRIDAVRLNDERYARLMREREINALAAEAELRALRAQINPHFLFNALTTLGYLIQSTPNRAFEMLMHLTTLLRSALRSEGEFTTLRHEQELVNCYLQIERERFEERLQAEVDVPDELLDATIPSLIVQPLVENAIKHGIARSRDGGRIVVRARPEGERRTHIRITVSNTGAPLHGRTPGPEGGIGLKNVEHRLRCYYGDGASLALATAATGETVAEILVPVADAPEIHEPALVESSRP